MVLHAMSFMSSIIHTEQPTTLPYISGVPEWQKFGGASNKIGYILRKKVLPNRHWKLGQWTKLVVLISKPVHSWLISYFSKNKSFLFFKIESWNSPETFTICLKMNFEPHKVSTHSDNCYLHFFSWLFDWVEILWDFRKFILNRCWEFQLSV